MKSTTDMQAGISKTKQRQMSFEVHISPIFLGCHIWAWSETRPIKAESINGDATSKNKKGIPSIPWNN